MKLFENIAEYNAFKRKYEIMGELEKIVPNQTEEERIAYMAGFSEFFKSVQEKLEVYQSIAEIKLQERIERQKLFLKFTIKH